MWIVAQPYCQLPARLSLGQSQHAFEIHELAGRRRAKVMDAAPLDIQLITGLLDVRMQLATLEPNLRSVAQTLAPEAISATIPTTKS